MGSLKHRGTDRRGLSVWELQISLGRDVDTGKYGRFTERIHGTKTEARRRLNRLEVAHDLGELAAFLAGEQEAAKREEHRRRVIRLRGEGLSLRAIAEAVGVTKSQVARDLAGVPEAGVPSGTPATIKGRDGKAYPGKHHGS